MQKNTVNITKKVAVVLLNWNGQQWLEKFLPTMIACSEDATIILADNQSTDNSVVYVKENFKSVQIIVNNENHGFAGGYNAALTRLKDEFEYYAIVNTDIEVSANWLVPLVTFLDMNTSAFSVQPKILSQTNKSYFEYAGASGGFIDKNYYPFCRGRIFNTVEKDHGQYDFSKEVFWTSGACMLVDAKRFHAIGGFDDDFFAHMEEIDLCWRAKNMGWSCYVQPLAKVYHVGGGTLNYESPKKTFLNFRNNLMMIHKNHPKSLFFKIFLRLCLDGVAGIMFMLQGKPKHCFAIIQAHFAYYGKIPRLTAKRKAVQANRKGTNVTKGLYNGSILSAYFLESKKNYNQLDQKKFEQ